MVETSHAVSHGVAGREHEDADRDRLSADRPGNLETTHVRQTQIKHDHVDATTQGHDLKRLAAGLHRLDDVSLLDEKPGQQPPKALIILDQQEVHGDSVAVPSEAARGGTSC